MTKISDGINTVPDVEELETEKKPKYSVFSHRDKLGIVYVASSSAIWSTISTPIYYPALQIIEKYFNISEELVNISVVVYMVAQGIAPTIVSGMADHDGRRPVILACLLGFTGTCIGLAVANKYSVILVLRVLQSIFIAPTISVTNSIVGDYTQRSERGGYVGLLSGFSLVGQAFGSLIGAGLAAGFGWRAIFWFLAIGGGVCFLISGFLLPETNRALVGNGSVLPKRILNIAPILLITTVKEKWHLSQPEYETLGEKRKTNYLAPFKILFAPELAICLLNQSLHFVIFTITLTTLSNQLTKVYGLTVAEVGLCYLPGGLTGLVGSVISGRALDWNYKRLQRLHEQDKAEGKVSPETKFNIIKARAQVAIPFISIADGFTLMFGWCIGRHQHLATVVISYSLVCFGCTAVIGAIMTLLIDLYPSNTAAAVSSINLTRCINSAVFVAVLTSMNSSLTVGGTFTLVDGLAIVSSILLYIPITYGQKWSEEREKKRQIPKISGNEVTV